jgi:sterol desaturase/sphingolipid hydroxylase (fatty acid hydroxylase superfamily)
MNGIVDRLGVIAKRVLSGLPSPLDAHERIWWGYLATAFLFAAGAYAVSKREGRPSFGRFLFPGDPASKRSAWFDVRYLLFVRAPLITLLLPLTPSVAWIMHATASDSAGAASTGAGEPAAPFAVSALYVVLSLVLADFGLFVQHWLAHHVPALWALHKVHHSAEAMTPLTVYRMHPLDEWMSICASSLGLGVAGAAMTSWFPGTFTVPMVLGVPVAYFFFYGAAYNLRHSHVRVGFGPALERFISSPAQHQIHHSAEPAHLNKNLGFMFSFWDWMFGSLVISKGVPAFRFGLVGQRGPIYRGVFDGFVAPVGEALRELAGRGRRDA